MAINNWRVGLPWPELKWDEEEGYGAVEYLYEDEAGETVNSFDEGQALAAMLISGAVFLNNHHWEDTWPEAAKKMASINVNTNDVFAWGAADAETITYREIEEVYRYWVKDPYDGTSVWAIIRNKQMPQRPVEAAIRKANIWDLDTLKAQHNLRANHYDGVSHVLAERKRSAYDKWCAKTITDPLPFNSSWWEGWKDYIKANPNWNDEDWQAEDKRAIHSWRLADGFEQEDR